MRLAQAQKSLVRISWFGGWVLPFYVRTQESVKWVSLYCCLCFVITPHVVGNLGEPRNMVLSIVNAKFSNGNTEFSIVSQRFCIGNAKFSNGNTEFSIVNPRFSIVNTKFSIDSAEF